MSIEQINFGALYKRLMQETGVNVSITISNNEIRLTFVGSRRIEHCITLEQLDTIPSIIANVNQRMGKDDSADFKLLGDVTCRLPASDRLIKGQAFFDETPSEPAPSLAVKRDKVYKGDRDES